MMLPDQDIHDQALIQAVAPPTWKNPDPSDRYDLVVIGGGSAGLITALGAVGLGKRVALIEKHRLGGDCLNTGCVPSKALIRSARALEDVRRAPEFGVRIEGEAHADFPQVMERMRRLRASIAPHDSAARMRDAGIDVYFGAARFVSRSALKVGGRHLDFRRACIATGARPTLPPIPGLAAAAEAGQLPVLTSENVFELRELPARLAVIGAGAIGCELAQTFARLGAQVHLVESAHGLLPREDSDAATRIEAALHRDGVTLHCCGRETTLEQSGEKKALLRFHGHDGIEELEVDALLVATGRRPNVEQLGLEAAGVELDDYGVRVDDHLRTTNRRIFAAGDVCSRQQFTHAADAMARIVIRNALLGFLPGWARVSKVVIPRTIYTDPEVAQVGATAAELSERGTRFQTVTVDLEGVDRARLDGEGGLLKIHVGRRGRILGATFVSRHAGETLPLITTAMVHGISLQKLSKVVHAYPTQAEAIKRAADSYFKTRLLDLRDLLLRPWRLLRIGQPAYRLSPP